VAAEAARIDVPSAVGGSAMQRARGILVTLIAIVAGLVVGGIAMAAAGAPPLAAYAELVRGAFGSSFGVYQSL
jgi:general nucleoside transport system permease protein